MVVADVSSAVEGRRPAARKKSPQDFGGFEMVQRDLWA
jgi:hypothetical protein